MSSDHRSITTITNLENTQINTASLQTKWKIKEADWDNFQGVAYSMKSITIDTITKATKKVADLNIPKRHHGQKKLETKYLVEY